MSPARPSLHGSMECKLDPSVQLSDQFNRYWLYTHTVFKQIIHSCYQSYKSYITVGHGTAELHNLYKLPTVYPLFAYLQWSSGSYNIHKSIIHSMYTINYLICMIFTTIDHVNQHTVFHVFNVLTRIQTKVHCTAKQKQ